MAVATGEETQSSPASTTVSSSSSSSPALDKTPLLSTETETTPTSQDSCSLPPPLYRLYLSSKGSLRSDDEGVLRVIGSVLEEEEQATLPLEDIFPEARFVVTGEQASITLPLAVEALCSSSRSRGGAEQDPVQPIGAQRYCAFGPALQVLVEFLMDHQMGPIRLISFLETAPNYGVGSVMSMPVSPTNVPAETPLPSAVSIQFASNGELPTSMRPQTLSQPHGPTPELFSDEDLCPSTPFYDQLATLSGSEVVYDLVMFVRDADQRLGLETIKFLPLRTGGRILLYPTSTPEDSATLPQDIYRIITRPMGLNGLLRIRTSNTFEISNAYGPLRASPIYENLYHLAAMSPSSSVTFDFAFSNPHGFFQHRHVQQPCLQLAISYRRIEIDPRSGLFVSSPRLRIHTMLPLVFKTSQNMLKRADSEVILCVLVQKLMRVVLDHGVVDGRTLLVDWLTNLTHLYMAGLYRDAKSAGRTESFRVDAALTGVPALRNIPRFVFALLMCPFLKLQSTIVPPQDYWSFLHCSFNGLNPSHLRCAIYPHLSVYGGPNNLSTTNAHLSNIHLTTGSTRYLLLDAYTHMVLYCGVDDPAHPFPPPKSTLIRQELEERKRQRELCARVDMVRVVEEKDLVQRQVLEQYLMDESTGAHGAGTQQSYNAFLERIVQRVGAVFVGK